MDEDEDEDEVCGSPDPVSPGLLLSAFADAPLGVALCSPTGDVLQANPALCDLLGVTPAQLRGRSMFEHIHPGDRDVALAACSTLQVSPRAQHELETRFVHSGGRTIDVVVSTSMVRRCDGEPQHVVMYVQDISVRKALEAQLVHQTLHDALTSLPNRVLLADRLAHALAGRPSEGHAVALLYVDLDGFKAVNDTHGHDVGDELLAVFAQRLLQLVRPEDTVARLSGDEFAVFGEFSGPGEAERVAERIRRAAAEPFTLSTGTVAIGSSIGIATSRPGDVSPQGLLQAADRAMYAAKAGGGDGYVHAS